MVSRGEAQVLAAGSETHQDEKGCEDGTTSQAAMGPACPTELEVVTKATVEPSTELASILCQKTLDAL